MVRLQIVEQEGADLYRTLVDAMRQGQLRTFVVTKRGRKVTHTNEAYPGWMNWSHASGIILCEVLSPHKPGSEWRLLSAFIGRLADKFADRIHSIAIQFPGVPARAPKRRR